VVAGRGPPGVAARLRRADVVEQAGEDRVGGAQVRDDDAGGIRGYGCPSAPPGTPELVE